MKITKGTRVHYEGKINGEFTICKGTITSVSQQGNFCTIEFDNNDEVRFDYFPTIDIQTEANGRIEKKMVTLKVYKKWHENHCV